MPLLSLDEARTSIIASVRPLDPVPTPLAEAHGRVLREEILAPEDLPAFDRSAMDGYALSADDTSEKFRVIAEIQAGQSPSEPIRRGECVRIFTGAQIPRGATQVIMQEDVEREGEWMIPRRRDAKTWIRWRGEDARRGDLLLEAGTRLRAGELSLLAQLGAVSPRVSPAPRVLHFATGNELVDPATQPAAGQIRDSNSILVSSLLVESGARLVAQARCGDTLAALTEGVMAHAEDAWDVLLISGGASVGDYDFGVRALEQLGFTIHFRQINIRPGKPLVFATRARQVAFVIPGNPVSHFVTFHVAIRLALECLECGPRCWPLTPVELAADLPMKADARETWWPTRVVAGDETLRAYPLAWQSSGDLRGLVSANALLPIPSGTSGIAFSARWRALLLQSAG
jgi:molybdopterin molybdotransferase